MAKKKNQLLSDDQLAALVAVSRRQEFYQQMTKRLLAQRSNGLIESACEHHGIRELSRLTGLSSTYLSQVRHGNATLSTGACQKIVKAIQVARRKQAKTLERQSRKAR